MSTIEKKKTTNRGRDGCPCVGAAHAIDCDRPDVAIARDYERARRWRAAPLAARAVRRILALVLAADPEGGGHEVASAIAVARAEPDPEKAAAHLVRAVELAVGRGAEASEQGDRGRQAAWLRVRAPGVQA